MQKFLVNTSGLSREKASQINGITLFLFMLLQPIAGALSDRIGRKPLMIGFGLMGVVRSEEHTSELQSLMRTSYAVFCLKKKTSREPISNSTSHCTNDYDFYIIHFLITL